MRYGLGVMRLLGCMVAGFCLVLPAHGVEIPKKHQVWYFGEGLDVGDEFTFEICDPAMRIPETDDHCYAITMRFLAILPTYEGMMWVVATHVDHKVKTADMIFQISSNSFKIRTDVTNIAYADSIERTVGWIRQFSNENRPQVLSVGKSWGVVGGDSNWPSQIMVNRADSDRFEKVGPTYLLSHSLLKESQIQIKDGFPFPLKATVYKPVSSHQDIPLAFAFQITSYQNADNNTCHYIPPTNVFGIGTTPQQNENQTVGDFLPSQQSNLQNQNSTDVEEFTISEMLKQTNDNSTVHELLKSAYGEKYRENLRQSLYNFTKFIEMIANASNTALQSQLGKSVTPLSK